jgi:hypothetical protein
VILIKFWFKNGFIESSFTSNENDGSFLFTLASLEGFGERYPYQIYAGAVMCSNN